MTRRGVFLLVWAVAAAWTFMHLSWGWFAADAGTLGLAAQRVLAGELPHRDFVEAYTGGLAFLDALAFRAFGDSVMSMRWVAFGVFLAWVPAVWFIAVRVAGPALAAVATLLAASWTLPAYAEGMPSWYNLFLGTFGVAALLRYVDRPHPVWLFVAGMCGGLSILFKIVGLYFVAAGLLFLLWVETVGSLQGVRDAEPLSSGAEEPDPARDRDYRLLTTLGCTLLAAAVAVLVVRAMGARFFLLYAAPPLAGVAAFLPWALRPTGSPGATRGRAYLRLAAPFLAGVAVPVALFLVPYALSGSVRDLVFGVLVLPQLRLDGVRMIGPVGSWLHVLPAVLLVAVLVRPPPLSTRPGQVTAVAAAALLATVVALGHGDAIYTWVFRTLLWLPPVVSVAATVVVIRRGITGTPEAPLLLATFGLLSLVQIPFAAPAYFFYAAPLMVLVAVAVAGTAPRRAPWLGGLLVATLAFTVLHLNVGFSPNLGFRYRPEAAAVPLEIQRARGVRVSPADKADYEGVVRLVDSLDHRGVLYAAPDAPEIYFLTGLVNPTPTLYEFMDHPEGRDERVLDALDRAGVRVLVIRRSPLFSAQLSTELLEELARRYTQSRQVGRFLVAWKPTGET